MPNETDDFNLTDQQMDRALSEWQADSYHKDLAHREEMDRHDRFMEDISRHREEREAAAAEKNQTTDFTAILKKNVSKAKRIPIEQVTESWAEKDQAAQREAEVRPTTLAGARLKHFGGKLPVFHEGEVIEVIDPNQEEPQEKEIRKGTHSRHVHKPKTSRSKVVWRPKGSYQRDTRDADPRVRTDKELRGDI